MNTIVSVKRKPNPVKNANCFSQLFFLYMFPIFRRTFKKELTEDDIFEPLMEHRSGNLGDKLEKLWKDEYRIPKHQKTALHRALFKLFGFKFMLYGIIKGVEECFLVVLLPISIGKVVQFFQNGQNAMSRNEVYMYSGFITFTFFMDTLTTHPTFMGLSHLCMKMRVACSTLLYRKSLRLSRTSLAKSTVGQIINLLSNDVSKFDEGFVLFHFIWIAPVQVCIGLYLIYREIQVSAFFGMAFLLAFIPLQIWVGQRTSTLRLQTALRTDERVRIMNEIITGIQVIKMYCWEKPFAKLIELARKKEMKPIRAHQYLIGLIYAFEMFITRTSIFISVLSFVLLGNFVSAEKVFAITGIYNVIRPLITTLFSISISTIAEVNVSVNRINTFLCLDEFVKVEITEENRPAQNGDKNMMDEVSTELKKLSTNGTSKHSSQNKPGITLENVSAVWIADAESYDLENLNLQISSNELVAVIGPVGGGKSSLIHLFLKELTIKEGTMDLNGRISYAPQEPWLFSGTIRQNILFGEKYDKDRYDMIVKVCALEHDFELFPFGDKTFVGERGKILSGGQKARINLARCVYKEADIYLLDDPLSAVDVNVGKHLYFKCVNEYLKDKICILITHQLQYLHTADKILIMEDGKIQQAGTYEELQTNGLDFAKLLQKFDQKEADKDKKKVRSRQQSITSNLETEEAIDQFQDEEEMGHGKIKMKTYYEYFSSGGHSILILFLFSTFLIGYTVTFGGDYFITYWVNLEQDFARSNHTNTTELPFSRDKIIYSYSGITLGTIIFAISQTMFFMAFLTKAATNLHNQTFTRVINATMQFFNANPSGRILNRFSEDIGIVDDYIPHVVFDVLSIALLSLSVIVLASLVEWVMFPASLVLGMIFIAFRSVYIVTSRNVKRIVAVTRSPMYSHITATAHGITTIRAFNAESILIDEFDFFQDRNSSANFLFLASSQCFGFWISLLCVCFITLAIFSLVIFGEGLRGGDIGLLITEYIGLLSSLDWGMRQWSELENQMTSTERVIEYKYIENEPKRPAVTNIPKQWPTEGRLVFKNVNLRYKEGDPYVLKEVSFTVQPKEKIGIVGRTGAGKSSIITCLFQLYPIEGSIIIDGIDTTKLPLEDVRNKISIIPQEPVLFSGTMRKNLDPFEEYSDEVLWNALEQVELKETVDEMTQGLHSLVSDSGSNFSVGERQLVCLARALIRNNKILVLDEATANVDPYTDSLIQKTIRNKFADCTVLTVAHRLNTVMDSDKILVMRAGRVEEFDHPHLLLEKKEGLLYGLVQATGETTSKQLETIAKENYEGNMGNAEY
ncbi:probable multidrug resistance-associated protein lethal(2)03659 [Harmonia axyridis]|uniref:probable multidrug resistance-associated protein lethal(2)03659 n=1 Tax=Harmonia axyridis TaxID=115357 RepID=UPI001E276318|nr:probable multidrug resistance-associated protein lethal(2)03659 [Harmonia axyridis]